MDFDALFDDVYPKLRRYCMRMTADRDLAEDTAQEAFVRLLDREVKGGDAGLRSWLFKVATHLLRDRARVRSNRLRLLESRGSDGLPGPAPGPDPGEELEREERRQVVREALARLDERDRTLLLLREEGLSYRELAGVAGVEVSSVGTLLARSRRRLERELTAPVDT